MFGVNIVSASQVSIFGLPVVQNPVFRNASLQLDGSAMIKLTTVLHHVISHHPMSQTHS